MCSQMALLFGFVFTEWTKELRRFPAFVFPVSPEGRVLLVNSSTVWTLQRLFLHLGVYSRHFRRIAGSAVTFQTPIEEAVWEKKIPKLDPLLHDQFWRLDFRPRRIRLDQRHRGEKSNLSGRRVAVHWVCPGATLWRPEYMRMYENWCGFAWYKWEGLKGSTHHQLDQWSCIFTGTERRFK